MHPFCPNQETSLGNCDPCDQTYFPILAISILLNSLLLCSKMTCTPSLGTTSALHLRLPADLHSVWLSSASSLAASCGPSLSLAFVCLFTSGLLCAFTQHDF